MSSPPPPSSNPLKRPSISSASSQPLGSHPKRPRMHPLRQTSFPNTIDADTRTYSDAGSVTGSFTGSLGGTSADGVFLTKGKKRGRKSKAEKEREREEGSLRAGMDRLGSVDVDGALLVDAFNPIQSERYDLFKRAKLRKETLRRIVNHALSQSVPASVVTTINGFTKVFAGEIIEKARTVQAERPMSTPMGKKDVKLPPNPHRGQLLPSHLREALRRYKRDGEGGGVGFSGLSMGNLGVRGSVTWSAGSVGGRRIFR
ncbi:hypothetical protein CAN33_0025260 [Aspergillus niger]|uniref:TAFII28-like protein domain-containing protein n=1 Tax=Aspergillus niger TaxID=5061 RepID=A0A505IFP3_ASPNG|nr:hypothetical protein CAN33_0025260 [Aspergillus niger]